MKNRFSEYRVMWLLVFFDMPTETKAQRREYAQFRKFLIKDGFRMFQFSIYSRYCMSIEAAETHKNRIRSFIPQYGDIGILMITDKQFGAIEVFHGMKKKTPPPVTRQLELF